MTLEQILADAEYTVPHFIAHRLIDEGRYQQHHLYQPVLHDYDQHVEAWVDATSDCRSYGECPICEWHDASQCDCCEELDELPEADDEVMELIRQLQEIVASDEKNSN